MRILAWVGGIVAVLMAALVAAVLLIDWNRYRDDVAQLAGEALGRDVVIGAMDVDPGWTTHIGLRNVTVSNSDGAVEDMFADIPDLKLAIRLWPLVRGDTNLPYIKLSGATVNLERDESGRANWEFGAVGEASVRALTPDEANEFPVIGTLEIVDTVVKLVDRPAGLRLEARVSRAGGAADRDDGLSFVATGNLADDPLEIEFSGGPVAILREGEKPYPVNIRAALGPTRITARGHVTAPFAERDLDLQISVKGPDLAAILPSLKLPFPHTPPYDLSAQVAMAGEKLTVAGLGGRIGETDIAGRVSVTLSGEKPFVEGAVVSDRLYFDDLAPMFGLSAAKTSVPRPSTRPADKKPESRAASPKPAGLFPDIPLDQARLETVNASLDYRAKSFISEILPLESLSVRITLKDSLLDVDRIRTAIANGTLGGRVVLDARQAVPMTDLQVEFQKLGLKPFFANSRFVEEMGGAFSGFVALRGTGNTVADALASADGKIRVKMNGGSVSGLLVEGAGLDLVEALALLIEDARVPIRCGRIDADAASGLVTMSRVIIDTTDSTLLAGGTVNLKTETLGLQVEARAKDFSLIDLAAPVRLYGPLADPGIGIGGIDPLPFLEMGDQKNVDCAKLLSGEQSPADR